MKNYEYVSKKEYGPVKNDLIKLIHLVQEEVREYFTFRYDFIGSASRNMITREVNGNIGYDFDVNIRAKSKTQELIHYLKAVDNHQLVFASIHALKVKYLIELGYLNGYSDWINDRKDYVFRDLLFESFETEGIHCSLIIDALEKVGLKYVRLSYMQFWLDMEWLLWTIEQKDKRKGYIKVNTIKVAFGITPKIFLERGEKKYYDSSFSKKLNSYLKLIDGAAIEEVKHKYRNSVEPNRYYGYSLLYRVL